ncbi:xanthine dehydrogenase small subunit [Granulicella rosea]|uniref:Xanthine dehydrogenase small subunit n=1 Tax=Granulicella rosea TaxID=474952 RepID=A0A239KTW8_9BACT|nr:FAD binding domain-containing protein [Granulicella rosea]SNT21817.1 xanthine dehydrogenase small subunit [Granulicella rosea]
MRANAAQYELIAPATLDDVLATLATGGYTPIAGGTEIMVALSAGRLPQKPLVSLQHLKELRFIETTAEAYVIGAGTTFSDIRHHAGLAADLPLLAGAASWTGSIANQNRGTLGGNLVNASPAADSPPALLAYEATLKLVSATGSRTMPYTAFHLGYKKTALLPGELVYSIAVPRIWTGYRSYTRKVGTRNAQAISKIALACLARIEENKIADIRIGAASLSAMPMRCAATESALLGQPVTSQTVEKARAALASEARPIDDIRSTAAYRAAVAGNLLEEFLQQLST